MRTASQKDQSENHARRECSLVRLFVKSLSRKARSETVILRARTQACGLATTVCVLALGIAMDPSEIEFLAEETIVTVIPNFNCRKTYLITGELGPFRAGIPLKVPLWLAADLKRRQKCQIVPPAWMDLEKLEKLRDEEAESPRFCEMPSEYYIVEAKIILDLGIEDDPSLVPIMSVIKDIWDRRMAKLTTSVNVFMQHGGDFVRIPNLTQPELNIIRPLLPKAMNFLSRLAGDEEGEGGQRRTMEDSEMSYTLSGADYFSPSSSASK